MISTLTQAHDDLTYLKASPEDSYKVYDSIEEALVVPDRVKCLVLRDCAEAIPQEIKHLTRLECLHLKQGSIRMTKADIEVIRHLEHLKCLDLTGNVISEVTDEFIAALPQDIKVLSLGENRIEEVERNIGKLSGLQLLDLSGNPIRDFPDVIKDIKGLKELWIFMTQIKNVNVDLRGLEQFELLNMGGGILEDVTIELPISIRRVNFASNKLEKINGNFRECLNLEILNLMRNPKLDIPQALKKLEVEGVLFCDVD